MSTYIYSGRNDLTPSMQKIINICRDCIKCDTKKFITLERIYDFELRSLISITRYLDSILHNQNELNHALITGIKDILSRYASYKNESHYKEPPCFKIGTLGQDIKCVHRSMTIARKEFPVDCRNKLYFISWLHEWICEINILLNKINTKIEAELLGRIYNIHMQCALLN